MIVDLPTGRLRLAVARDDWPLDALADFAARDNPRRGFLIVSKLLGRHIGAVPSVMRRATVDLAAMLPADLPGPVLVFGMAETAICLGQMIHEDYRRATGRDDVWYLHSTRQQIDAPLLCRFEEPHSHASAHLVYQPTAFDIAAVKTLVMVDDEISTGTTLANLAGALAVHLPLLERIVAASLIDWSGADPAFIKAMPAPAARVSLLAGSLDWQANPDFTPPTDDSSFASAAASLGRLENPVNFGRLGLVAPAIPPLYPFDTPSMPGSSIRMIGTGEFTYPAFQMAEAIEKDGFNVTMHSTTRSPALIGHAMISRLGFSDNYGTGVPNYLYNVAPDRDAATFIAYETPPGSIDPALAEALDARLIGFSKDLL